MSPLTTLVGYLTIASVYGGENSTSCWYIYGHFALKRHKWNLTIRLHCLPVSAARTGTRLAAGGSQLSPQVVLRSAAPGLAAAGHLSLQSLHLGQLCRSHLAQPELCLCLCVTCFTLRLRSGNILLANSKSHSPVLEAGERNVQPLDNGRDFKHCTPHILGFLHVESVFGCWEPKRKDRFRFGGHTPLLPHVGSMLGFIDS